MLILGPPWALLGCLWALLGPPWALLGSPWALLGPLGPFWASTWALLGALWALLGLLLDPLGLLLGSLGLPQWVIGDGFGANNRRTPGSRCCRGFGRSGVIMAFFLPCVVGTNSA